MNRESATNTIFHRLCQGPHTLEELSVASGIKYPITVIKKLSSKGVPIVKARDDKNVVVYFVKDTTTDKESEDKVGSNIYISDLVPIKPLNSGPDTEPRPKLQIGPQESFTSDKFIAWWNSVVRKNS